MMGLEVIIQEKEVLMMGRAALLARRRRKKRRRRGSGGVTVYDPDRAGKLTPEKKQALRAMIEAASR